MFSNQFLDFVEHSDSLPGKTLRLGDFNIHFENGENNNSRRRHDIIDILNLTQSVTEPTHYQVHLLDLNKVTYSCLPNYTLDPHLPTQLSCANLMYLYPNKSLKPYTAASKRSILTPLNNISLTLFHQTALFPTVITAFVLSLTNMTLSAVAHPVRGSRHPGSAVSKSSSAS